MLSHEDVDRNVVTHKDGCPVQRPRVRPGRERGVYVVTCPRCKAGGLADESGARIVRGTSRPADTRPAPTTAQYRCPEHGTPVTWRGTGCEPCQHDRETYRTRRIERRSAALTEHAQPEGI